MGQAIDRPRRLMTLSDVRFERAWRSPVLPALALTALAAWLRLRGLGLTPPNPFYDAAVRSMSLSWHNFFVGAYDPRAQLAVDKTPVDLWFQVLSVKLLGFNQRALTLPAAISGTLAVPVLYDLVRRPFGMLAGICAGIALAVLPISVVASRSDALDSMMMALAVVAAWLCLLAVHQGRARWLYVAALVMGIDFNVKLFEALVPLPALALLYLHGAPHPWRRRLGHLAVAGGIFAAVSVAWLVALTLLPGHHPYAIGSKHGSAWNAVFVYNGLHRLAPHRHVSSPSLFKPVYATRLGPELIAAWVFGGLALLVAGRRAWRRGASSGIRAGIVGLGAWLLTGTVLYARMRGLRLRYLEGFTPSVAAVMGIGVAVLAALAARGRLRAAAALGAALAATPLILSALTKTTAVHPPGRAMAAGAVAVVAALVCVVAARLVPGWARFAPLAAVVLAALALTSLLYGSVRLSRYLVRAHATDSGPSGQLSGHTLDVLDRFLKSHRDGTRYEYGASDPSRAGGLIIRDAQPVVLLETYNRHPVMQAPRVRALVMSHQVRWFIMGSPCRKPTDVGCVPVLRWVTTHGTYVTKRYGLPAEARVYELTPASVSR